MQIVELMVRLPKRLPWWLLKWRADRIVQELLLVLLLVGAGTSDPEASPGAAEGHPLAGALRHFFLGMLGGFLLTFLQTASKIQFLYKF